MGYGVWDWEFIIGNYRFIGYNFVVMIQEILIGVIFLAAAAYLVRLLYKNFTARPGCATGCGKCQTINFQEIEKKLNETMNQPR